MPPSKPAKYLYYYYYYSSRIPANLPLRKWIFTFLLVVLALSRSARVHAGFTSPLTNGFYRPVHYNLNHHFNQLRPHQSLKSKDKVEFLGAVLKRHIADLRQTKNKQVELVFLVDNSGSVGSHNFFNEIKFVRKLLADFTVDENTTRVAIVTFSSRLKIIKHVDFLTSPSPDNHKCSLLEEYIPKIRYSGGGTYTKGAFMMADKILHHARRDARKAVILITDGFSNAGDPRPLAAAMRSNGVKIFTFGIRHGNVRELMDMASHPKNETCYILDSFEEFEALARRALHEDLQGGSYSRQVSERCNKLCLDGRDCCDKKAFCTCGTHTGNYECLCQKGYYGNGLIGGCLPCPSGTYKNMSRPGDIMSCTRCPDENHMTEEGATSADQCHCKKGFRKFGENRCASLVCEKLSAPTSGYFVNEKCSNNFNAACGTRCQPGYELQGDSVRVCQEDGQWSGNTTQCVMKTCPFLPTPKNGNRICSRGDFTYSTVCRFTCDNGYKLIGSRKRTCLAIAYWSGMTTKCREITCQHLKELASGTVSPEVCTGGGEVPFGTTCKMTCNDGYSLDGPHTKQCTPDGIWSPVDKGEVSRCIDTRPPLIVCPSDIEVEAEKDVNTANVTWIPPFAIDNSGLVPTLTAIPAVEPPTRFPIGVSEVTYVAEDASKNKQECKFRIVVKDTQAPRVDRCPRPSTIVSEKFLTNVTWVEPLFSDNSNKPPRITKTHTPNSLFPQGVTNVTYTAFDESDNASNCTIKINIIEHKCIVPPAPANGLRDCFRSKKGMHCSLSCMEGYAFAIPPPNEYYCDFKEHTWSPADKLPFPDCSAQQMSNDVIQPAKLTFMGKVSCQEKTTLNRIADNFQNRVNQLVNNMCGSNMNCNVDDLRTTCEEESDYNRIRVLLGRSKRSVNPDDRTRRHLKSIGDHHDTEKHSVITFDFKLEGTSQSSGNLSKDIEHQEEILDSMKGILEQLKSEAEKIDENLLFTNISYNADQPKFLCKTGSVLIDKRCVRCPVGTFFNVVHRRCLSCGKGTYQHQEGMVTCMVCPAHTSTLSKHSKTINECKAQCLPGSFSHDGLEFCETCPIGFYQPAYTQKKCVKCPNGTSTVTRGSRLISDCKAFCKPGYVSETGMELCIACPLGTYQSEKGKTSCFLCPNKAPTNKTGATRLQDCKDWDLQGDFTFGQQRKGQLSFHICFIKPCRNGGTCEREGPKFKCKCPTGFTGSKCELIVDSCKAKPCLNGGHCSTIKGSYKCSCKKGFTGTKCEIDMNGCFSNPCKNGARCVDTPEAFLCTCPNGFEGATCEKNIDECASKPCMNGGTCVDFIGRYTCTCKDGYEGVNCEINIDECATAPCQNNGTCEDEDNGYTCTCVPGFVGKKCEQEVKECLKSPCLNAGTCEDKINDYTCRCQPQYTGKDCETELDSNFIIQFDAASTTNYAAMTIEKPLNAFSLSFWMKSSDLFNYGTVVSYATPNNTNAIIFTDYSGFILYVNGKNINTDIEANDGIWHHLVVTWTNDNGAWNVYLDALPVVDGTGLNTNGTIPGGGSFVIGQEQDEVGGNFNQRESFIGQLGQLNLWDRVISLHEIEHMLTNCDKIGNVIAWPAVQGSIHGQLKKIPSVFCQDCKALKNPNYGKVRITDNSTGSNAIYSCNKGYILAGRSVRMCLASAEWDDIDPECEKVSCNRPRQLKNGYVLGRIFTYDNRVRYSCNRGYRLIGANTSYCMENGEWSNADPICEEITCSQPILSNHTILLNKKSPYLPKFIAEFKCEHGYKMITNHSKLVCQSDGTWDKSVPSCDGTLCGNPPEIKNGRLQGKTQTNYFVGDVIKYECNFGFTFQNGTNPNGRLLCKPDGLWEKSIPTCGIINCGNPSAIHHGTVYFTDTDYLSTAEYTCNIGHQISHEELLECLEEGLWQPKPPTCNAVICKPPKSVENAEIIASNNTYGSILTYKCKTGFQLVGKEKRECSSNGNWTGESPTCEPVRCPKPDVINNGYLVDIGSSYTYGSVVRFKCNPGYSISNTSDIICGSNGTWKNNPPTCTRANCPPPPTVKYGHFNATVKTFVFSDSVDYSCELGYILSGASTLSCNQTLLWTPDVPICNPIKCSEPEKIENGIVRTDGLEFGRKAGYECLLNHKMVGEDTRICRANKTWSGERPQCVALTCEEPSLIDNGYLMFGNLSVGAILTYKCSSGYYLLGDKDRTCLSDLSWSGYAAKCLPVLCPEPENITNGYRNYTKKTYKSEVIYDCDYGYKLVGKNKRTCTENKRWSGAVPKCEETDKACPELKVKNGYASIKKTVPRPKAHISCNYRHTVVGLKDRECLANGSWSGGNEAICAKNCLYAPFISHGTIEGLRTYNKNVTYTCDNGYRLEGNPTRTCLLNGTWSGETPKCVKITCPSPLNITNGTFRHLRYLSEPLLIYKCNPGFKLEGKHNLICRSNGSWTPPTPPKCVQQLCPEIVAPRNATLSSTSRFIGTSVHVICDEGFRLRWNTSLYCKPSLTWGGVKPACTQYACVQPGDIANGFVLQPKVEEVIPFAKKIFQKTVKLGNSRLSKLGGTITYTCNPGYTLVGDATRRCITPYRWSGKEPECVTANCPQIVIVNGLVDKNHDRHPGATVIFKCLRNFQPKGKPILRCSTEGEWIGENVCEANVCPEIIPPDNTHLSSQNRNVGSHVKILCDPGFVTFGQAKAAATFCLPNLKWTKATLHCKPVSCGKPAPILNGKSEFGSSFTFNSTIRYECNEGYDLIGNENRTCLAEGSWSGITPTCERKTCGPPPSIANGTYAANNNRAEYNCDKGYTLIGDFTILCGLDGKWNFSEPPVCKPNRCGYNPIMKNGSFKVLVGEAGWVNSKMKVACDMGYRLRGEPILLCLPSGNWDKIWPECEPIYCPEPPTIENGDVKLPETFLYGQYITYVCHEDYAISGNAVSMCQANGTWSNELPKCLLNVCPTLAMPENGKVSLTTRKVGSSVTYYCKDGYTINGLSKRFCLDNKTWSGPDPFCEKIKCEEFSIIHGQLLIEQSPSKNDRAQYKCNPGFKIKPGISPWFTCINGKWVGSQPSCIPIKCPTPPALSNAVPIRGDLSYSEKLIYTCVSGYEFVDDNFLVCGPTGKYVGKMPECRKASCGPPPGIQYATMTMSASEEKAVILCNQGYILEGSSMLHCLENKTWPATEAKCVPLDCGSPPKLDKASVSLPNGTTYGAFAEYTCFKGLVLVGRAMSMCQMDGTWQSTDDTSCVLRDCGKPRTNDHVKHFGTRYTLESLVFYSCENGYILEGATLAFCLKDGKWSNPSPTCNPVSCGDPPEPPYEGLIVYSEGHHYKNIVEYGCYGRMMPDSPTTIQCMADSTWNGTAPGCYEPPKVVCGPPLVRNPETVKLIGSSYTEGDSVFYLCRHGLSPKRRPSILVCQSDGTWNDEAECKVFCKFTCRNGGRCIGYNRCKCQPGYAGSRCEKPVCILPCLNGGYCGSPFKCTCKAGYTGTRCQNAYCRRKCENGGRCIRGGKCICPVGFRPPYCSKRTSESGSLTSKKQWTSQSQKQKTYLPVNLLSKVESITTSTTTTTPTPQSIITTTSRTSPSPSPSPEEQIIFYPV